MKDINQKFLINKILGPNFVRRIEWKKMVKYLEPSSDDKFLDIACGQGMFTNKLARMGCDVYGIDISEEDIEIAKIFAEKYNVCCDFKVGNAEKLPYSNESFDKIICSSSLEHFENSSDAVKEMWRVLKNDGLLVLTVDSFNYPISNDLKEIHRENAHVIHYYSKGDLKNLLKDANFRVINMEYLLNSKITNIFFTYGIKKNWQGFKWALISLLGYPICSLSDSLFGDTDKGYTLVVKAKK